MAIRFTPEYNAEIRRVVKNFNQKRNRAVKRGFKLLPPLLSTRELKLRYETKSELDRELNRIKRFNRSGDEALKIVETSGGAKAIKWEYDYLKSNLRSAIKFYDREIEEAARFSTPMQVTKAEYLNNMKAKRDYLNLELSQLDQSQFKTFRATINEYLHANEARANGYRNWMNEVEIIMRNLGYDNKSINKFFEGFDALTPRQFLNMYRQNSIISRIYELYIPNTDGTFELSTSEEDAKDLIDTFMEQKDEMIMKAKFEDEMNPKDLEDFVKSLTDERLTKTRQNGKAKLKRKDLTPKQIKELEALGWDDLIE
jgi:hypothetical protein